jgi:hypothetical protein
MRIVLVMLLVGVAALPACRRKHDTGGVDRSDGKVPEVAVPRRSGPALTIDGQLDEPAWKRAGATGAFVRPHDGLGDPASPVHSEAWLLWDDEALYVAVRVRDRHPTSPFGRDDVDPHVWSAASGIELMLQPGDRGDNRDYYEVQVDVNGAVWDTRFDDYNQPVVRGPGGVRYGHQDWQSGLRRAVHRGNRSYTVELALPWSSLVKRPGLNVPPRAGDVWRANLYAFRDGQRAALAWSPILGQGNFHKAARFGRIQLGSR